MQYKLLTCFSFLSLLLLLYTPARAQVGTSGEGGGGERTNLESSVFGLGINVSPLSGAGVSMRHHLPARVSYMLNVYGLKTSDELTYNYGLEIQYDLVLKERLRFFFLAGASHFYTDNRRDKVNLYKGPDRFGGGFGIETNLIGNDFCVSLSGSIISFQPIGDLIPYPSIAAHYYFR